MPIALWRWLMESANGTFKAESCSVEFTHALFMSGAVPISTVVSGTPVVSVCWLRSIANAPSVTTQTKYETDNRYEPNNHRSLQGTTLSLEASALICQTRAAATG
ncbi:MAG: hypothetical protein ABJZ55_25235 [Fuerstiella sp.]